VFVCPFYTSGLGRLLHCAQAARRLLSSSPPPCARGTMWSVVVALPRHHGPLLIWHTQLSRASILRDLADQPLPIFMVVVGVHLRHLEPGPGKTALQVRQCRGRRVIPRLYRRNNRRPRGRSAPRLPPLIWSSRPWVVPLAFLDHLLVVTAPTAPVATDDVPSSAQPDHWSPLARASSS